jgi:hypothetical protein
MELLAVEKNRGQSDVQMEKMAVAMMMKWRQDVGMRRT